MSQLLGIPQALIVTAVGVNSTIGAAIIGGAFLVGNTVLQSYLSHRRTQKRKRERRRNPRNYSGTRGRQKR